jgi:hypothetical protein
MVIETLASQLLRQAEPEKTIIATNPSARRKIGAIKLYSAQVWQFALVTRDPMARAF